MRQPRNRAACVSSPLLLCTPSSCQAAPATGGPHTSPTPALLSVSSGRYAAALQLTAKVTLNAANQQCAPARPHTPGPRMTVPSAALAATTAISKTGCNAAAACDT